MKNRIKSLLIAGVLFATIGCSKDQTVNKYDPSSEDAMTAYFVQKGVSDEFSTEMTGDQKMYVEVYRQNNQGELTVGIDYSLPGDSRGFFSFPKDVTFKDGDFKTTMEVIVHDVETLAKGATYNATATIGSHHEFEDVVLPMPDKMQRAKSRSVSIAEKYKSVTVSVALALDWQPAYILKDPTKLLEQKPAGTEDADWYKMKDGKPMPLTATWQDAVGMEANTENLTVQRATGTNVFRVMNFGDGGGNIIFMIDASEANKVTYKGDKYYRCVMTPQDTKTAYDASANIFLSDFPSYTGTLTYDERPCIWDGENTLGLTLYWYVPGLGSFTGTATDFTDLIIFSSGEAAEPEPEVEISYLGLNTTSTGVKTHSLKYEPNGDAAKYLATVLKENLNPDIDQDALAAAVFAFLEKNGITQEDPDFEAYFNQYFGIFYAEELAAHEEEMLEKLAAIRDKIEAGTYESDVPVLEYSAKNEDAWNLGNEDGLFTAVAFSYDESGAVKGIDYSVFLYNPGGDPEAVEYAIDFGAGNTGNYTDYSMGYFGDNSLQIYFEAEADDITAISYVLLTAKEFADAGLTDNSSKEVLRAYVEENGRSLSAAALKQVNHQDPNVSYYVAYLAAKAATDYKLITSISNADATKVEINSAKTEAAETPVDLKCALALKADATHYTHTSVYAEFTGKHIVGGTYVMIDATSKGLAPFISIDKDGKVTMKDGVTDANMVELIEANGSAFSTGETAANPAKSDLFLMNKGGKAGIYLKATPEIRYIVLACADYDGAGAKKWTSAVISSDFAPAVTFSQTAVAKGKTIEFNWKSAAQLAGIFQVKQVVYALVPKSALTAAGVDMANISNLNDFDARSAQATTDAERDAIEAQRKNATKISEVLSANAKYFKGDAAAAINSATGVTKQFPNVNAGEYALIGLANDTYNTGLQVSPVTIQ